MAAFTRAADGYATTESVRIDRNTKSVRVQRRSKNMCVVILARGGQEGGKQEREKS